MLYGMGLGEEGLWGHPLVITNFNAKFIACMSSMLVYLSFLTKTAHATVVNQAPIICNSALNV